MNLRKRCMLKFSVILICNIAAGCVPEFRTVQPQEDMTKPSPTEVIQTTMPQMHGARTEMPTPQDPIIIAVQFPASIIDGGKTGIGEVRFSDPEGDIHSAQFTLVAGGCMDFEYFAYDPMQFLHSGDRFGGTFQFQQSCIKCADSEGDVIRMRIELYDIMQLPLRISCWSCWMQTHSCVRFCRAVGWTWMN